MSEETVEIPVDLAQEIVELGRKLVPYVGSRAASVSLPQPEDVAVQVQGQGKTPWTRRQLADFKDAVARLTGATAVLSFAAQHPDEVVKYTDILSANPELDPKKVRAELGAMTKVAGKLIGEKKWPLQAWQDSTDGVMRYRMPAAIAAWWRDV
jgi:hypothetical protein